MKINQNCNHLKLNNFNKINKIFKIRLKIQNRIIINFLKIIFNLKMFNIKMNKK